MRIFIHSLVILTFVLSGISPACAFMAGEANVIQICAADGSVKTVLVSEELNPMAVLPDQSPTTLKSDCPFCIAFGAMKAALIKGFDSVFVAQVADVLTTGPGTIIQASALITGFIATGPPALFVM